MVRNRRVPPYLGSRSATTEDDPGEQARSVNLLDLGTRLGEVNGANVKFRFAFAPCIVSVAILSLTCVVVSCLVVGLCDTS